MHFNMLLKGICLCNEMVCPCNMSVKVNQGSDITFRG